MHASQNEMKIVAKERGRARWRVGAAGGGGGTGELTIGGTEGIRGGGVAGAATVSESSTSKSTASSMSMSTSKPPLLLRGDFARSE